MVKLFANYALQKHNSCFAFILSYFSFLMHLYV